MNDIAAHHELENFHGGMLLSPLEEPTQWHPIHTAMLAVAADAADGDLDASAALRTLFNKVHDLNHSGDTNQEGAA